MTTMPDDTTQTQAQTQPTATAQAPAVGPKHTLTNFSQLFTARLAADKAQAPSEQSTESPPETPGAATEPAQDAVADADAALGTTEAKSAAEGEEAAKDEPDGDDKPEPQETVDGVPKELAELARKHGFIVDRDGKVTNEERHDFRAWARRKSVSLEKREKQFQLDQGKFVQEHQEQLALARDIMKALADKDFDALAKAAKFEDWNELEKLRVELYADPHYLETLETKRQLAEMREQTERERKVAAEARAEAEHQAHQAEQARAISAYKVSLAQTMAKSEDPLLQALADDPRAVEDVFVLQQKHWSAKTRNTISVEQAAESLRESHPTWKKLHMILSRAKQEATKAKAPTGKPAPAVSKAKTAPTPTPEAKPKKRQSEMTPAETSKYFQEMLQRGGV